MRGKLIAAAAAVLIVILGLLSLRERPGSPEPDDLDRIPAALSPRGTGAAALPPRPLGRYQPGALTPLPRFVTAPVAPPEAAPATASAPPPRLEARGTGQLRNRLENTPPNFKEMQAKAKALLAKMHASADQCLAGWSAPDPALKEGVMLAIELDKMGLQAVSIKDMVEIPDGPLRCLSNAAYELDWGGVVETPMMITVPQKYAAP